MPDGLALDFPDQGALTSSQQEAITGLSASAGALQGVPGGDGGIQYNVYLQQNNIQLQQIRSYELQQEMHVRFKAESIANEYHAEEIFLQQRLTEQHMAQMYNESQREHLEKNAEWHQEKHVVDGLRLKELELNAEVNEAQRQIHELVDLGNLRHSEEMAQADQAVREIAIRYREELFASEQRFTETFTKDAGAFVDRELAESRELDRRVNQAAQENLNNELELERQAYKMKEHQIEQQWRRGVSKEREERAKSEENQKRQYEELHFKM